MRSMSSRQSPETRPPASVTGGQLFFLWFVVAGGILITALLVWNAVENQPYWTPVGIALSLLVGGSLTCAVAWAATGFGRIGLPRSSRDGEKESADDYRNDRA